MSLSIRPSFCALCAIIASYGCNPSNEQQSNVKASQVSKQPKDLASARKSFVTKLTVHGPAPQDYTDDEPPPRVREVHFRSGDLDLKGWLSNDAANGNKRPAVVFLHGGWSFGGNCWEDVSRFTEAGFVMFMPMLRGENGNPGHYESFLSEVDDVIAAGHFVSKFPYVDEKNIFIAGHSVGGVLTCLAAMLPSPFKAAASLDGYVNMEWWAAGSTDEQVPYDRTDPKEVFIRNPMEFTDSLRCPLRLFSTKANRAVSGPLASRAKLNGKDCVQIIVEGDHLSMVAPAVELAINWFEEMATAKK